MMPGLNSTYFLDTNIVLYAYGTDAGKKASALALLAANPMISTQVINECSHVMRRKLRWPPRQVAAELDILLELVQLHTIHIQHIRSAWQLAGRYGFSHYDSLIIASALAIGCNHLYSEDLQHDQLIADQLRIINPFL